MLRSKRELIASAGLVLAQLEIPLEAVEQLATLCAEAQVPLMLDPAPAVTLPKAMWKQLTWFTPNESEAAFYGIPREEPAAALQQLGLRNTLLKQGADGCTLVTEDGSMAHLPAPAVRSVDTTAAGDAFNAAFAVALMEGGSPKECAVFAVAAAALSVTRAGAQTSLASRAEVDALMA